MNKLCLLFLTALALCLGPIRPGMAAETTTVVIKDAGLAEALDAVLENAIAQQRLVGGVVLVAHDGKIVYSRAAGFMDRENALPMGEDAIFRLSSVSKVFTTMAVGALIQQGKMTLDDPVTKWLPEFTPKLADGTQPVITVRHLLSHTAGLTYGAFEAEGGPYHRAGVSDGLENAGISLGENMRRLGSAPLLFAPGTSWQYSLATDVLGAVIANVTGLPLPDAMGKLVTGPLGLKDTGFTVTDRKRLTLPYYNAEPRPMLMKEEQLVSAEGMTFHYSPGRILDPNAFPSGGAGMAGTAPDVLRLLETIRQGGAPLVGADLMRTMTTNQTGEHQSSPGAGFGLGWAVLLDPAQAQSPQSVGTIYWGGVYGHSWFVDPARKLSVVLMTNTAMEGLLGSTVQELRNAIYANLP